MAEDQPIPRQRQAGKGSHSRKGAIAAPERHHLPNCKQVVANQDFVGIWMVSICWERHSQRSALQKRHTAHLCCVHLLVHLLGTPRKLSSRDGRGDMMEPSIVDDCTHQAPGPLSWSDLERAHNAGPTESAPLWSTHVLEP